MIYVTFDGNGVCNSVTETAIDIDLTSLPVTAYEVPNKHTRYELVNNNPVELPAETDVTAATWEQVKAKRNELRESPVTLDDGRTFDADEDSFVLFRDSIDEFDNLPGLDVNGKLPWKMTNNVYEPCSKQDLIDIYTELRTKRAVRASILQEQAEILFALNKTLIEISDPINWGI